ncbi:MAG: X-Pro aminopeptidase [Bacteroidetes bacterium]|jgi:Xaa-Pro aminopeptidase|nr:X-Pro aminopeptidase [Bacteroidota bacterium]|tara:strand:+ start:1552 stop:2835 length:1284 start_codon:yes stop_codon:yes gene_type:complete
MRYLPINNKLFVENRKRFTSLLPKDSAAIFYSNDQQPRNGDQYFPFRQQSDFFYLTGINQEKSILLIIPDIEKKKLKEALFLIKTNEQIAIWEGHKFTKDEAKEISGIENIYWLDEFDLALREVMAATNNIFLNRNENPKFCPDVKERNHRLGEELKNDFPLHNYSRSAPLLAQLRLIKSKEEIALLRNACNITNKAFRRVLETTSAGKFEYEIQGEIEHEFTLNSANGNGYAPIIAAGKNACVLHYIENDKECKDGDLLLLDVGAEYAFYSADMSRTIPINGKFTKRQKECYNAVLSVFKKAKKLYVPGNTINKINDKVDKLMEKEMLKLGLFTKEEIQKQDKEKPLYKKYFMHGTAHFLGLDVHDVGGKDEVLQPGMVLTCEPGLYIREENIGIRIENDLLITKGEPIDLMKDIPIEINEIEGLM